MGTVINIHQQTALMLLVPLMRTVLTPTQSPSMHIASHAMGCIHAIISCICGYACIWQGQLPHRLLHSRDSNVHKQFEAPLSYGNTPSASVATQDINRHAAYLHNK